MHEIPESASLSISLSEAMQKIQTLSRENDALKSSVETLQQKMCTMRENATEQLHHQEHLEQLREANQHLLLATFGAQDSKSAAEAVNKHQTIFLSMLAHELRNPIASIAVANSVLESLNLNHLRVSKLLAITRRQANHLVRLVDDLLDISRINTGKISLQTCKILLNEVLDSAVETAQPLYVERGQTVQVTLPPGPVILFGDMVRLSQLFSNLLINASKFSDPSAIVWVTASQQGEYVRVVVKDHGKGIAPKYQSGIFDLFSQGEDASANALSGGLGIGLSLVKTIAEMHAGSVEVASAGAGCGSEFTVMLPLPTDCASSLHSPEDDRPFTT